MPIEYFTYIKLESYTLNFFSSVYKYIYKYLSSHAVTKYI